MGRPALREGKKKLTVSLSLSPEAFGIVDKAENKSRLVDKSLLSMQEMVSLIAQLRDKKLSMKAVMEEIEDLVDVWESEFDETEEYKPNPTDE